MHIYYQWIRWSYSYMAAKIVQKNLNCNDDEIIWLNNFNNVREKIKEWNLWVLPVENSYAGNIHTNLYNFLRYDVEVIGEVVLEIDHCLLSKENNISDIKKVYSHPQWLWQCYNFLKENNIQAIEYSDTATSAQMISQSSEKWIWAIASQMAGEIYWLNILAKSIQDQKWNRTRFFLVKPKDLELVYPQKVWKITVLFETKNIPAALYKCLWWFATNSVNLTKIESLPSLKNPFTYIFWVDMEGKRDQISVQNALEELRLFSEEMNILWEY